MQNVDSFTEVTFHYLSGERESFDIPITPEAFRQQLESLLSQPWLTLHLFDRTVFIRSDRIVKVEVKPPFPDIQGEGVFTDVQRVTALTHGAKS
jgi:hypothetical protein